MEKGEFIYALHEVFQALLEDIPVPEQGHPGYQEAMIVELLNQTLGSVEVELDDDEFGDTARRAAWTSIRLLLATQNENSEPNLGLLDDLDIDPNDPRGYRSENLTREVWCDLLGADGLENEFLWDRDWKTESIMDTDPAMAESVARWTGIDLKTVHAFPHTPSDAETRMAEHYLRYLSWGLEAENSTPSPDTPGT